MGIPFLAIALRHRKPGQQTEQDSAADDCQQTRSPKKSIVVMPSNDA